MKHLKHISKEQLSRKAACHISGYPPASTADFSMFYTEIYKFYKVLITSGKRKKTSWLLKKHFLTLVRPCNTHLTKLQLRQKHNSTRPLMLNQHASSSELSDLEETIESLFEDDNDVVAQTVLAVTHILDQNKGKIYRGRLPGAATLSRGPCTWYTDYLSASPVYPASTVRQVFRIPIKFYWKLHDDLLEKDSSFEQQRDCFGKAGHTSHQKLLCSLRRLGTGLSFAQLYDMSRMSSESQRIYFRKFLSAVVGRFGSKFLNREPNEEELRRIVGEYDEAGFPGSVGCVDCMHLHWKNCPKAMKGQYHNPKDGKLATISCEALVDRRLYCWHWFSGRCGTNNDITVLDNSPLFNDILSGKRRMTLPEGYFINGVTRTGLLYMLADGIYPDWAIFVLPNHAPLNDREQHMTKRQEAVRKDVERFFGCLQGRFKILRQERHEWSDSELILISQVCIILQNMIVKMVWNGELSDEIDDETGVSQSECPLLDEFFLSESNETTGIGGNVTGNETVGLMHLLARDMLVGNWDAHIDLASSLSHHLWNLRGASNEPERANKLFSTSGV